MRKTLSLLLCAALCLCAATAPAETVVGEEILQITTTLSFDGDAIYFGSDPEFFVIVPHDWIRQEMTEEETAAGLLLKCTDPDEILTLHILCATDTERTVEEVYADFAANPSVANLTEMYVDRNYYMVYDLPETGCYCATTTPGGGQYVTYMFSAPDGAPLEDALEALGSVPYEILGEFNNDVDE